MAFTLSVIVPAYNEEGGLPDTLASLLRQTEPPDAIYVVDDGSSDRTAEVARSYPGVTVLQPPSNLGSKARAQNYALPFCEGTDLVLPVDADTVLGDDYIRLLKEPFVNPDITVAAGSVQTKITHTPTERGRSIEYLAGFHFERPIQNLANSPTVCSGCCSVFRLTDLAAFGGFPERTIVEDMDYTWSQQIAGKRAIYISAANAWAADPETIKYLRKQVWRWASGSMQNIRIHGRELFKAKPMLALWMSLRLFDVAITTPLWWLSPIWLVLLFHDSWLVAVGTWIGLDMLFALPILMYASWKRRINPLRVIGNLPFAYLNKVINTYYVWKAFVVELILVPLGKSKGLTIYEKRKISNVRRTSADHRNFRSGLRRRRSRLSRRRRSCSPRPQDLQPMRRVLGWIAALLTLAAVAVVCLGAWKAIDPLAGARQHAEQQQLEHEWSKPAVPVVHRSHSQAVACSWPRPGNGQPFALMHIPALWGRGQFGVVQGTTLPELATGPGHVIGTSMPGGKNFAVAAHDITAGNPFMHLKSLRKGDKVYVVDKTCRFTYKVTRNPRIVWWTNTSVLRGEHNHHLITLITCTPVTLVFVPHRVIVQGELVNVRSR